MADWLDNNINMFQIKCVTIY